MCRVRDAAASAAAGSAAAAVGDLESAEQMTMADYSCCAEQTD